VGKIEELLRSLLEEERSKDRKRERERERSDRQEAALRQKDQLLRRMREEERGTYEASPGPNFPREASEIRA
jgi:hypothetical protein